MATTHIDGAPGSASLAALIREARQAHGLSTRQLEAMSGVAKAFITRVETGTVEQPSAANLLRLARALELDEVEVLAAAGIAVPRRSVALDVMLRTEYDLPPEAVEKAMRTIRAIVEEYNQPSSNREEDDFGNKERT